METVTLTQFSRQTLKRHLLVWFLVLIKFTFFTSITGSLISKIVWVTTLMLNFSFSYYFLLVYIWPNIFDKKKFHFIFVILFNAALFITMYYLQVEVLIPCLKGNLIWQGKPFIFQLKKFLINFSYVFFSSWGSYYNLRGIRQAEKSAKIEKETINQKLIFLKNQFHSHLTFNFLNFCYNRIRHFSLDTATHIEEFSYMLRYSLSNHRDQFVTLEMEIEYIKKFISFQRCITDDLHVNFIYEGELNVPILPRILVVYVENAFKHGVLQDHYNPVMIKIRSSSEEIFFSIANKKNNQKAFLSSGIGLENIGRVLQLFYPSKHSVSIINNNSLFSCELKINPLNSNFNESRI
jgi:two-component system LytT family sensor kinase